VAEVAAGIVKGYLVPGSVGFLVVGVFAGVVLLYSSALVRWGRRWLLLLALLYVALGLPVVSQWLERGTRPVYRGVQTRADAAGATAIVVLGNGIVSYVAEPFAVEGLTRRTAFNIMEGARLYQLLEPPLLVASGGFADPERRRRSEAEAVRDGLVRLGVPADRVRLEPQSVNTHEQAVRVASMLADHRRIVLVTTPIHMPRAVTLFEAQGLQVVPSPSRIDYTPEATAADRFIPSASALRASELSIYEYLGLAYGWTRGWMDSTRDTPP
jgi:uncharacterized SAM-binding protein YcdF (DUF218 family)